VDESSATDLVNALYDAQRRGMLRYLVHAGASVSQAEDIVQDVFMELYASLRSGKSIENPRPWLFTVARHAFLKHCNANHKLDQLDDGAAVDMYSFLQIEAPEPHLDDVERRLILLTPRERQVITLRLSGLKYREIAAQLGISFKTAHTLLTRGLKKLHVVNSDNSMEGRIASHEPLKTETLQ
jgi:RNA polymerase sigma-70 factor (ECF subfamily)